MVRIQTDLPYTSLAARSCAPMASSPRINTPDKRCPRSKQGTQQTKNHLTEKLPYKSATNCSGVGASMGPLPRMWSKTGRAAPPDGEARAGVRAGASGAVGRGAQRPLPVYRGLLKFPPPAFGPGLTSVQLSLSVWRPNPVHFFGGRSFPGLYAGVR